MKRLRISAFLLGIALIAGLTTGVSGAAAGHSVTLTWMASTDMVTGYNVYRTTNCGTYAGPPLNGTTPVTAVTFTDSTVTQGTYCYVVRSVIVAGTTQTESVNSNEVKAVILPAAPTALQDSSTN